MYHLPLPVNSFVHESSGKITLKSCVLNEIRQDTSENTEYMFHCSEFFLQWKYGEWKYAFYFINSSQYFIYKYNNVYN
jgi:hypothetical protein